MTLGKLHDVIIKAGGNDDTIIQSDSGWECSATECDGVMYDSDTNTVTLMQESGGAISFIGNHPGYIHGNDIRCYGGCKVLTGDDFIGRTVEVSGFDKRIDKKTFVFSGVIPTFDEIVNT